LNGASSTTTPLEDYLFFDSPLQSETLVPSLDDTTTQELFTSPSLSSGSSIDTFDTTVDDLSPLTAVLEQHQLELDRFDMALLAPEDASLTSEQAYAAGEDFTLFG
jgi:hypothetical protein